MELELILFLGAYLAIILSLIHFFHNSIFIKNEEERSRAKAFTAGISLTYIFIHLFPKAIPQYNEELFYGAILFSFIMLIIFDSYLYLSKTKLIRRTREKEHALIFAFYNFIGGTTILYFLNQDILSGTAFFIPMALHNLTSAASIRELKFSVEKNFTLKTFLSFTPLFGVIVASFFAFGDNFTRITIGLLAGSFLYITLRELIPSKHEKHIGAFVKGIIIMFFILSIELIF